MSTSSNPYQSPATVEMHPAAAEWLASPSVSLSRVATGLGMMYVGIVIILFAILLLFGAPRFHLPPETGLLLVKAIGCAVVLGALLEVIGPLFCLATPAETGAAGFIYASVATMVGSMAIEGAEVLQVMEKIEEVPPILLLLQPILGAISLLTFMLFLQRLNGFIGRPDLARKSKTVFVVALALIVLQGGFLTYVYVTRTMPLTMQMLGFATLGVLLGWLIAFMMYANLLTNTRKAILRGSGPR